MISGVVASETERAQTDFRVGVVQVDTADRPMLIRGCDITQDQVRELKFRFEVSDLRHQTIIWW